MSTSYEKIFPCRSLFLKMKGNTLPKPPPLSPLVISFQYCHEKPYADGIRQLYSPYFIFIRNKPLAGAVEPAALRSFAARIVSISSG